MPIVLSVCFKFLQSEKAFKTVGLFRLNASKVEVNKYKCQFDFSNSDTMVEFPSNLDPHIAASVVKSKHQKKKKKKFLNFTIKRIF